MKQESSFLICDWTSWVTYLERLALDTPGDLPDLVIKPASPVSPALQVDSLLLSHRGCLDICGTQVSHIAGRFFTS